MRFIVFRRRLQRLLRAIITIGLISTIYFPYSFLTENYRHNDAGNDDPFYKEIPASCECLDKTSGIAYNFCYRLPPQYGVPGIGKRFSCEWLPVMKKLGLLDTNIDGYFRFDRDTLPTSPPFVTAASESHFNQEITFIKTVQKFLPSPDQRVIIYDLGLSKSSLEYLRRLCNVEYRRFDFDQYPEWIRNLGEYRWKPLVIAEALKEFGAVWYMDSSVQLEKNNLSHVYALLNCRAKNGHGRIHSFTPQPTLFPPEFIESGFHVDTWLKSIQRCDKFAYMLQGFTGHGIFSATDPSVYTYIPTNETEIKRKTCKMYEAGHIFVVRTFEAVQDVLKWYVLCALERDCMASPTATVGCSFNSDRFAVYAGCHRYDQSVVNLLLANRNYFDSYHWSSGIVDFFHIVRGGGVLTGDVELRQCH